MEVRRRQCGQWQSAQLVLMPIAGGWRGDCGAGRGRTAGARRGGEGGERGTTGKLAAGARVGGDGGNGGLQCSTRRELCDHRRRQRSIRRAGARAGTCNGVRFARVFPAPQARGHFPTACSATLSATRALRPAARRPPPAVPASPVFALPRPLLPPLDCQSSFRLQVVIWLSCCRCRSLLSFTLHLLVRSLLPRFVRSCACASQCRCCDFESSNVRQSSPRPDNH